MRFKSINGQLKIVIPLEVEPHSEETSTLIGTANGTFYGSYSMDYKLPDGDYLRLFANHNKSKLQLVLLTHDPEKIKKLPGKRQASLVANTISQLNRYLIHYNYYPKPRSALQIKKYELAAKCIERLQPLLSKERSIKANDWSAQEDLRAEIIGIIEVYNQANRLLANHPLLSEGKLGLIFYETTQVVQKYQFNRLYPISKLDQLDFTDTELSPQQGRPCFVWDSELYLDNEEELLDSLRVITKEYNLKPGQSLKTAPPNRLQNVAHFFKKIWQDCRDWVDYLANPNTVDKENVSEEKLGDITVTKITPYYHLEGLLQKGYTSIEKMIIALAPKQKIHPLMANSVVNAKKILTNAANGSFVVLDDPKTIIVRLDNQIKKIHFFKEKKLYYPLPSGEDLFELSQLSKEHLFFPERAYLRLKSFFSQIPSFFISLFKNVSHFITNDLHNEFYRYIYSEHDVVEQPDLSQKPRASIISYLNSLQEILRTNNLLRNGQTLESFVEEQLAKSPYIIARESHPQSPPAYDNPLHRSINIVRHVADFFIDTSEKNPIIGTLAMAAYAYGAGAILAPELLTKILTKLHLSGLIKGIEPTQAFGHWMSNSPFSEAVSAAVAYWQATIAVGSFDEFFIDAVEVLKDDPSQIAIIVALAISLGYGLCKAIPALKDEVGTFPYINYGVLGAKGGAAIYDTILHPGEDWLIGSIKWLLKGGLTLAKIFAGPFIEAYYFGFNEGFLKGLKKSGLVFLKSLKQLVAALADLILVVISIPFKEFAALFIHVPFLGITNLLSKTLGILGNWQSIGEELITFATRPSNFFYFAGFRLSPLYGFHNPIGEYIHNRILNFFVNLFMLILLPTLELIKNLVLLPLIDLSSVIIRLLLCITDPLSRGLAYGLGNVLYYSGIIWDNSLGFILRNLADGVTYTANFFEGFCGVIKQFILGKINVARRQIFDWGFGDEDLNLHSINSDKDFYCNNPMNLERLPHSEKDCLLDALLPTKKVQPPSSIYDSPTKKKTEAQFQQYLENTKDELRPINLSIPEDAHENPRL